MSTTSSQLRERKALECEHGRVWTQAELENEFTIVGYSCPIAVVIRKVDAKLGSVRFQGEPRYYWGFAPDISA